MTTGDALDIERPEALLAYLRASGRIGRDEHPRLQPLTGGVSSRVILVEREQPAEAWVLKQALRKLRVAVDWFSDPDADPARGARPALAGAPRAAGYGRRLVFEDAARTHLLAMEAVPQPHENWKTVLLAGCGSSDDHVASSAGLLGTSIAGRGSVATSSPRDFDDRSFFESLRVEPYYVYTATQVRAAAPFLDALDRHEPADAG